MDSNSVETIVITLVTALGSTAAWRYYERWLTIRAKEKKEEEQQVHLYRDDLRERVAVLESKLEESYKERNELMVKIIKLSESLAAMKVEIEFLRKENEKLRAQLNN